MPSILILNISVVHHYHLGLCYLLCRHLQWPSSQWCFHWLPLQQVLFITWNTLNIPHNLQNIIQATWPASQSPSSSINSVKTRGCDHPIYWSSPWHKIGVQLIPGSVVIIAPGPACFPVSHPLLYLLVCDPATQVLAVSKQATHQPLHTISSL